MKPDNINCSLVNYFTIRYISSKYKLEPDGTEEELVPGFRVIVLTGPCPEIFEGGGRILDCWGIFETS